MHRFIDKWPMYDPKKDINKSTRYDDQTFGIHDNEENHLSRLSLLIVEEINASLGNFIRMERLQEQYVADAAAAQEDNQMGYYMRYLHAYEFLEQHIRSKLLPFRPIPKLKEKCKWKPRI